MTRLDVFFLISTLLVFFSLIEVLVTTILDNNQQTARAKKIDRYCRIIFPAVFLSASIVIFMPGRAGWGDRFSTAKTSNRPSAAESVTSV